MAQLTILLKPSEKEALFTLAEKEFRDPRAQAALIIRAELERRGLLPEMAEPEAKVEGVTNGR